MACESCKRDFQSKAESSLTFLFFLFFFFGACFLTLILKILYMAKTNVNFPTVESC